MRALHTSLENNDIVNEEMCAVARQGKDGEKQSTLILRKE